MIKIWTNEEVCYLSIKEVIYVEKTNKKIEIVYNNIYGERRMFKLKGKGLNDSELIKFIEKKGKK